MKVKELIELLKTKDQELRVVTNGYEGGYCDLEEVGEVNLKLNVNTAWYYGPHDYVMGEDKPYDEKAYVL
jgi:hypothetical protein